jgi:hypothetical protein
VRGTVIKLRISPPFGVYFWLPIMLLLVIGFIPLLASDALEPDKTLGVTFALFVAILFLGAVVGLWRGRSDRAFLVATLVRILNAEVD